jgi:hypothetical protein
MREMMAYAGVLVPFALASLAYYGSVLPNTMQAKVAQTQHGNWPHFLEPVFNRPVSTVFMELPSQILESNHVASFFLLCAIGFYSFAKYPFFSLILAWVGATALLFQVGGLPFYHWYYLPLTLGMCVLVGCGAATFMQMGRRYWMVCGAFLILPGPATAINVLRQHPFCRPAPHHVYMDVARWIAQNTPGNCSVGYCEIGMLGYYSHRKIIDPLGLVNRGFSKFVASHRVHQVFEDYRPDYIVDSPQFRPLYLARVERSPWFIAEYRVVTVIREVTIYKRVVHRAA